MVEGALAAPVVLGLALAVIWATLVARNFLSIDEATRVGARTGSVAMASATADHEILQSVKPALAALNKSSIESVVIYRASDFGEPPPAACTAPGATTSVSLQCNVYSVTDLERAKSDFSSPTWFGDEGYSPGSRTSSRSSLTPVLLGVYIKAKPVGAGLGLPAVGASKHRVLRVEANRF